MLWIINSCLATTSVFVYSSGDNNIDRLTEELSTLLREKLLVNFVFTMNDMKRIYQTKLAQCQPGHVLATGVSDSLLEKTVLSCGATKIHYMVCSSRTNTNTSNLIRLFRYKQRELFVEQNYSRTLIILTNGKFSG